MGRNGNMINISNIEEFQQSYHFFINRPNRAFYLFIFIIVAIIVITLTWSFFAKMDDIVKAEVLLRPATSISTIKTISGGEILKKNYNHNDNVDEGDLLLQLDITADELELKNSYNMMERIIKNIDIYNTLLITIQIGKNAANNNLDENYIYSEKYILEHNSQHLQIEELRIKLERYLSLPEIILVKQNLEIMARELEQAEIKYDLWKNNQIIEATNNLKTLIQNKGNLERRISDLERSIRDATMYAPISGRINEYRKLNIGDNVLLGEEILTIIPDDITELKAELYIEPAYIAKVKIGQKVIIRFPGLPPSKYGKINTEISLIPADYIMGTDNKPVFIVEVKIKEPWLESTKGDKIYLRAGIGAIGRVIVDQDSILMMILKKLDFIVDS